MGEAERFMLAQDRENKFHVKSDGLTRVSFMKAYYSEGPVAPGFRLIDLQIAAGLAMGHLFKGDSGTTVVTNDNRLEVGGMPYSEYLDYDAYAMMIPMLRIFLRIMNPHYKTSIDLEDFKKLTDALPR